jgi:acetyl esterase
MAPSPRVLEMLEKLESIQAKDIATLDPVEARKEDLRTTLAFLGTPEVVDRIENRMLLDGNSKILVRIYWPKIEIGKEGEQDLYALMMYFHGGGWVVGTLDEFDEICSMLANRSEAIVVSVDYRLAPEHKFPSAVHDCYAATKWVSENAKLFRGDDDAIIVAGDSAGGGLAIDVSLMARDKQGPQIAMQVPICPVTDLTRDMSKYSEDKYGPSKESMDWFIRHYIRDDSDLRDPLASPQFADLKGLPYTVFVAAGLDTLREQELDFVEKLEQSGVRTTFLDYSGMIHDFMTLPSYFEEGREAIERVALELRKIRAENI